jgi:hypothetical protein
MPVLFFHGEEILGLMAGTLLGYLVFPAFMFWLWSRPPRIPILPSIVYLTIACTAFIVFQVSDNGYSLILVYMVFSPWSLVLVLVSSFLDTDLGTAGFSVAGVINALLIYVIGWAARRRSI